MKQYYSTIQIAYLTNSYSKSGELKFKSSHGTYSFKHHDRTAERAKGNIPVTNYEKFIIGAHSKVATSIVIPDKVKSNLYWDGQRWVTSKDLDGRNVMQDEIAKVVKRVTDAREKFIYDGMTLEEVKKKALENIEAQPWKLRLKDSVVKAIQVAETEKEISKILKASDVTQVFESGRNAKQAEIVKRRSRQESSVKFLQKKRMFDELIFTITDEYLIEKGMYSPRFKSENSATKFGGEGYIHGVKSYSQSHFEKLGKEYIELTEKYYEDRLGKLPEGQKHVVAGVWHMDEKTPHFHVVVNLLSREKGEEKFRFRANDVWAKKHQLKSQIRELRELVRETLKERGYDGLVKDNKRSKKRSRVDYNKKLLEAGNYLQRGFEKFQDITHKLEAIDEAERDIVKEYERIEHFEREISTAKESIRSAEKFIELGEKELALNTAITKFVERWMDFEPKLDRSEMTGSVATDNQRAKDKKAERKEIRELWKELNKQANIKEDRLDIQEYIHERFKEHWKQERERER